MEFTKDQAERRFSKVFKNLSERWNDTTTFRRIAELGLPTAAARIAAENEQFARGLATDPQYDEYFLDRAGAIAFLGGIGGVAESVANKQLTAFRRAIDSASIVFIHSALDAAVTDLCYVSACSAVADWEPFVAEAKVTLSSLKTGALAEVIETKIEDHLRWIERQSLIYRVDRLFAIAKPPTSFAPKRDYKYDRERLLAADEVRHKIVHGDGSATLANVAEALEFLFGTGLYLFSLMNWKYDVKLNPLYAMGIELTVPPIAKTEG